MKESQVDPGSFRDPAGQVYHLEGRVFRTETEWAAEDFEFVMSSGILEEMAAEGLLLSGELVSPEILGAKAAGVRYVLEHPRLPFVSYPYEWCFSALKAAALLQLEIHLRALARGVSLCDASAYNVQFLGTRPVFIDHLSFRPYRDGEVWGGHRQFCELFLNPLLLAALLGVSHNAWYRGAQEGIAAWELSRLLPWYRKLRWGVFTHVVLQASFQAMALRDQGRVSSAQIRQAKLPLSSLRRMLRGLSRWIGKLKLEGSRKTVWPDYEKEHSYSQDELQGKRRFVEQFMAEKKPSIVWDLGCNTGSFSRTALRTGSSYVVGFEFDHDAADRAFVLAQQENLPFLPLVMDLANPSPNQGWAEKERRGLCGRGPADAVMALALVHHLAIGRNIPLDEVTAFVVSLAATGIIEFVPKTDPMVQRLLELRQDIFADYTENHFLGSLRRNARVINVETVSRSGRRLVWFDRD